MLDVQQRARTPRRHRQALECQTTGGNATPVLVSPAAEEARLARIASRVRFDPAMQQGAAFISDGTSSRLFFTNIGFCVYVLGQRRVEEVGEGKGV